MKPTEANSAQKERGFALDQLFHKSRNYHNSQNYLDALGFIVKLKNLSPFNAWLVQEQNPDVEYVASAEEWKRDFNQTIKPKARAYVILWPFAPVALVYDVHK